MKKTIASLLLAVPMMFAAQTAAPAPAAVNNPTATTVPAPVQKTTVKAKKVKKTKKVSHRKTGVKSAKHIVKSDVKKS